MSMRLRSMTALLLVAASLWAAPVAAVSVGQLDNFENGTTQNWVNNLAGFGGATPLSNVATGGPAGAGDNFLSVPANGSIGAGGRLVAINATQWAGNYVTAGITAIEMDVNNLGATSLSLRLIFEDAAGVQNPLNSAVSTSAVVVPAGSGWVHVSFPVDAAHLTALTGSVATALANAADVRLYHNTTATFPGLPVVAQLGVDNIRAVGIAVPEPTSAFLLTLGIAAAARWRRRTAC